MKRVKIGYDQRAKDRNDLLIDVQQKCIKDATEFFKQHQLPVNEDKLIKEGFRAYFNRLFSETYFSKLPEGYNREQRFKLLGIDPAPLDELQRRFSAHTALPKDSDFNIYAETPRELEKWQSANDLLNAWLTFAQVNKDYIPTHKRSELDALTKNAIILKNGAMQVNIVGYVKSNFA